MLRVSTEYNADCRNEDTNSPTEYTLSCSFYSSLQMYLFFVVVVVVRVVVVVVLVVAFNVMVSTPFFRETLVVKMLHELQVFRLPESIHNHKCPSLYKHPRSQDLI